MPDIHDHDEAIREVAAGIPRMPIFIPMDSETEKRAQAELREIRTAMDTASQRRADTIKHLCARFAIWGAENGIPYNSPSPLARGWLLGQREGPPYWHFTQGETSSSGGSKYSLLVKNSGRISELITDDASKGKRRYHLFPRFPQTSAYLIESIIASIGEFSGKYDKEWK